MSSENYSISSVVVFCNPSDIQAVCKDLAQIKYCEVYHRDDSGKIIVVIESPSVEGCAGVFKNIQSLKSIISAQMIYVSEENNCKQTETIPSVLCNESLSANDIIYSGDVQEKIDKIH